MKWLAQNVSGLGEISEKPSSKLERLTQFTAFDTTFKKKKKKSLIAYK